MKKSKPSEFWYSETTVPPPVRPLQHEKLDRIFRPSLPSEDGPFITDHQESVALQLYLSVTCIIALTIILCM